MLDFFLPMEVLQTLLPDTHQVFIQKPNLHSEEAEIYLEVSVSLLESWREIYVCRILMFVAYSEHI